MGRAVGPLAFDWSRLPYAHNCALCDSYVYVSGHHLLEKSLVTQKSVYETLLSDFSSLNKKAKISGEGENFKIEELWPKSSYVINAKVSEKSKIKLINQVHFPSHLDAVIFPGKKTIEFIYAFLDKEELNALINDNFEAHIGKDIIKCDFTEPSREFWDICRCMQYSPQPGHAHASQLRPFIDFCASDFDSKPDYLKCYLKDRTPTVFRVKTKVNPTNIDLVHLSRHINFILSYYNRESPAIVIKESSETPNNSEEWRPLIRIGEKIPDKVSVSKIDDHILKLLQIAIDSNVRHAFTYYYQIFEYAGFYHLEDKLKCQVTNIIQDPSMINCTEEKIDNLLSVLANLNQTDDLKMRNVITEKVNPDIIWNEISSNKKFYSETVDFEGGFILDPLISEKDSKETWRTSFMPKTFNHLTKIRNCLVHAREKRESKVILPTKANDGKL